VTCVSRPHQAHRLRSSEDEEAEIDASCSIARESRVEMLNVSVELVDEVLQVGLVRRDLDHLEGS
jgi:hypothetical protein